MFKPNTYYLIIFLITSFTVCCDNSFNDEKEIFVPSYLRGKVNSGDVVLTIGAGDITLLGPQILKYLDEKN